MNFSNEKGSAEMLVFVQYLLYFTAIAAVAFWIYFSIQSKRTKNEKTRGLYIARTNMAMGLMLMSIGSVQLFLYGFESWIRVIIGFIFILLGLFNLFAGIRNHSFFKQK